MMEFLNADEAAAELQRLTQKSWTTFQVLRAAKAGRLPVCFDFVGELVVHSVDGVREPGGVSPRVLDFDGVVRSLTPPNADGISGYGVLVEIQEAHRIKFSHKDGKRTRGIVLPTEWLHGGRIKVGHTVKCLIEDACVDFGAFLFHIDDLHTLVSSNQVLPTLSETTSVSVQPQAVPASLGADIPSNALAWKVVRPLRFRGYNHALYKFLVAEHRAGKQRPTARDVLEAWRADKPAEIEKVLSDSFDYYDVEGNTKVANLGGLRKAIYRMTRAR